MNLKLVFFLGSPYHHETCILGSTYHHETCKGGRGGPHKSVTYFLDQNHTLKTLIYGRKKMTKLLELEGGFFLPFFYTLFFMKFTSYVHVDKSVKWRTNLNILRELDWNYMILSFMKHKPNARKNLQISLYVKLWLGVMDHLCLWSWSVPFAKTW